MIFFSVSFSGSDAGSSSVFFFWGYLMVLDNFRPWMEGDCLRFDLGQSDVKKKDSLVIYPPFSRENNILGGN